MNRFNRYPTTGNMQSVQSGPVHSSGSSLPASNSFDSASGSVSAGYCLPPAPSVLHPAFGVVTVDVLQSADDVPPKCAQRPTSASRPMSDVHLPSDVALGPPHVLTSVQRPSSGARLLSNVRRRVRSVVVRMRGVSPVPQHPHLILHLPECIDQCVFLQLHELAQFGGLCLGFLYLLQERLLSGDRLLQVLPATAGRKVSNSGSQSVKQRVAKCCQTAGRKVSNSGSQSVAYRMTVSDIERYSV